MFLEGSGVVDVVLSVTVKDGTCLKSCSTFTVNLNFVCVCMCVFVQNLLLLRHHHEAESLHAVQKMDWEWKLKECGQCDYKSTPVIDEVHLPMVQVNDEFELLPPQRLRPS